MTKHGEPPPSRRTAALVGAVMAALGAWNIHRGRPTLAAVLLLAGAVLLLIALAVPGWARRFHVGWMRFAGALGYVNTRVILVVVYYLVLTPVGTLLRLMRKDPLQRRTRPRDSYWIPRCATRQTADQFERLF